MADKRKRFLQRKPLAPKKLSDYPVNELASALMNAVRKQGYKTELDTIAKGFHTVDIKIHNNKPNIIITQNIINNWEVEGDYNAEG
jgi:hypothetical protein